MRFAEFKLAKYGHFDGAELSFAKQGDTDLHLVYGLNEAGKTMFRKALSDFLFGFPHISFADFRHAYGDLLISATMQEGDREITAQRTKAKKISLHDDQGRPLDEQAVSSLLHGVTRSQYETEFAIDQAALHSGTIELAKDNDRFADMLYATATGFEEARRLLAQLEKQRDESWASHANKATRSREADKLRREQQEILRRETIDPKQLEAAEQDLSSANAKVDELRKEIAACRSSIKRLDILGQAGKIIARLDQAAELLKQAEQLRLPNHEKLLEHAGKIDDLVSQATAAVNDGCDLQQLEQEQDQLEQKAKQLADGLGWKTASIAEIAGQIAPGHTRAALEDLISKRSDHKAEQRGKRAILVESIRDSERELEAVKEELAQALGQLRPWQGTAEQLSELHFPSPEEHEAEVEAMRALSEAAQQRAEDLADAEGRLADARLAEQDARQDQKAPTRKDLAETRASRDQGFEQLLAAEDPQGAAAGYRGRVAKADEVADARFAHAAEAVQADERARQLERLPDEIAELSKQAEAAREAVRLREQEWTRRMEACGLASLMHVAYKSWLRNYDAAIALCRQQARLEGILKASRKQLEQPPQQDDDDQERFLQLLSSCGLPAESSLSSSRSYLQEIGQLAGLLERIQELGGQCAVKRKRINGFEENAAKLASLLADDEADEAADEVSRKLSNLLAEANRVASEIDRLQGSVEEIRVSLAELGEVHSESEWRSKLASRPQQEPAQERMELEHREKELSPEYDKAVEDLNQAKTAVAGLEDATATLADAAQKHQDAAAEMADAVRTHVRAALGAALMREALERYRSENEPQLMADASSHLGILTGGRYSKLVYDDEEKALCAVDANSKWLRMNQLTAGTVDQAYLALRLAGVLGSVRRGHVLPFVADDLFINFDDERAAAGFELLAQIACKTQVICLTHHEHLVDIATQAAPGINFLRLPR